MREVDCVCKKLGLQLGIFEIAALPYCAAIWAETYTLARISLPLSAAPPVPVALAIPIPGSGRTSRAGVSRPPFVLLEGPSFL